MLGTRAMGIILLAVGMDAVIAGPCDIYESGNTPCQAAHSTTRAMFDSYNGPLYEVTRASDNTITQIKPLSPGGVANSDLQDTFCLNTLCRITTIFDQTVNANHLYRSPRSFFVHGSDPADPSYNLVANATDAPIMLGGQKVYGVYSDGRVGYRNNVTEGTKGIPTGDAPEGIYAILDGTHYNGQCCFDYGNVEAQPGDAGAGTMETINWGSDQQACIGEGKGPWIQADLENGLFSGGGNCSQFNPPAVNPDSPSITWRFVTAIVKGNTNAIDRWAIRGGNSQSGSLATFWDGPRPNNISNSDWHNMNKQGGIILAVGGDDTWGASGTFYEGAIVSGYPTDAIEDEIQANVVAAGYEVIG